MTLGFESPLPLIFARLFAQSGTAAAAWSGMWYGLAIGAMNAATRSTAEPTAPVPGRREIAAVPPAVAGRPARRWRWSDPPSRRAARAGRRGGEWNGSRCWRG
jgi:hypothetical protein